MRTLQLNKDTNVEAITGYFLKFITMLAALLYPVKQVMLAVGFLVLMDFVTGIWASMKREEKLQSSKMRITVIKGFAYQAAILVAFVLETYLVKDLPLVKVTGALIGLTEAQSFFENIRVISGVDFWSLLISKLGVSASTIADTLKKKDNDQP